MVKAFADEFGVNKNALEKRIQRRIDAITPAQMVSMRRIYASLRDGMSTAAEWFEMEPSQEATTTGAEGIKAVIRAKAKREAAATNSAAGATGTDFIGASGASGADLMPAPTLAEALQAISTAANHEALDMVVDLSRSITANEQHAAEIDVAVRARRKQLGER